MTNVDGVYFEVDLRVLIYKVYGTSIHLIASAIVRHFRSEGHYIKGKLLAEAITTLSHLPLRSIDEVKAYPPVHYRAVRAIPYIKVV
jgi:hypothetical protein